MKLIDVYDDTVAHAVLLWQLLSERTPEQSISHKRMPTAEEHAAFVLSQPYQHWYVIEHEGVLVGACYVSKQQEIGIAVLRAHRRRGYACAALSELVQRHPGRLLANINPANTASVKLFASHGFRHIQQTYALETA
jgi:RimJ/RimL family protein N-acetyltransferase